MFKKIAEFFRFRHADREFVRRNKVDIIRFAEKDEQYL